MASYIYVQFIFASFYIGFLRIIRPTHGINGNGTRKSLENETIDLNTSTVKQDHQLYISQTLLPSFVHQSVTKTSGATLETRTASIFRNNSALKIAGHISYGNEVSKDRKILNNQLFSVPILNGHSDGEILVSCSTKISFNRCIIVSYRNYQPFKENEMMIHRNTFVQSFVKVVLPLLPIKSVYLRHLGMEIFEVPLGINVSDFISRIAAYTEFVDYVFYDELLDPVDGTLPLYNTTVSDKTSFYREAIPTLQGAHHSQILPFYCSYSQNFDNSLSPSSGILDPVLPNDPYFYLQWPHIHTETHSWGIDTSYAWTQWTGARLIKKFTIAIIDSGIDFNHPDLQGNIWINEAEICHNGVDDDNNGFIDDCYGWDFVNNHNYPADDIGHGTQSAGIIAAVSGNEIGIAGMCWRCSLMVLKVLNSNIQGRVSAFIQAIDYAIGQGVKVSNNSYGGKGSNFGALYEAIKRAEGAGMIFVIAAGNYIRNDNDKNPVYPASFELGNIISVAAISRNGSLASFSNYGNKTVHIGAPGTDIFTSTLGGYAVVDGTSVAVPFVTGAVALIWTREPDLSYRDVIQRILDYSKYCTHLEGYVCTSGVVNIWKALTENGRKLNILPIDVRPPIKCIEFNPCAVNTICFESEIEQNCVRNIDGIFIESQNGY